MERALSVPLGARTASPLPVGAGVGAEEGLNQSFHAEPAARPAPRIPDLIHHDCPSIVNELCRKSAKVKNSLRYSPDAATRFFDSLDTSIMNGKTQELVEVKALLAAVNKTETAIGGATLTHSVTHPSISLELIVAKQASLRELAENIPLKEALDRYLQAVKANEKTMNSFLSHGYGRFDVYTAFSDGMKSIREVIDAAQALPQAKTPYLRTLIGDAKEMQSSAAGKLARSALYRTRSGLKTRDELSWFEPRWKFSPRTLSAGVVAPWAACALVAFGSGNENALTLSFAIALNFSVIYAKVKKTIDDETALAPLRERMLTDPVFTTGLNAIGRIDELMSFSRLADSWGGRACIPRVSETRSHSFKAKALCNPQLLGSNPAFVPNDVVLDGCRLTIITGPNSGGKTTLCKTIQQTQILAQIGCCVAAEDCELSVAHHLAYQAPEFDSLKQSEGRFGTELSQTRDIFFATKPTSLVILDELAQGTTAEEREQQSDRILNAFRRKRNNTILVTHDHALAERTAANGHAQCLQVEYLNDAPTHRIVPGISRNSHAEQVAKRIGFSENEIEEHLRSEGYGD